MISREKLQDKNVLAVLIGILMIVAGYRFAFQRTIEAVQLNHRLKKQNIENTAIAYNPDYLKKKDQLLSSIITRYSADSAEWRNSFWLNVSRMAIQKRIHVQYTPSTLKLDGDTTKSSLLKQQIAFEGNFKNLVLLLDTLEKTEKSGLVSSVNFLPKKEQRSQDEMKKLYLEVDFGMLKKEVSMKN